MTQYKSLYEKYLTQLNEEGKIEQLSPEKNMQILDELHKGMEEFSNDQKMKEKHSEPELASIILI